MRIWVVLYVAPNLHPLVSRGTAVIALTSVVCILMYRYWRPMEAFDWLYSDIRGDEGDSSCLPPEDWEIGLSHSRPICN